MIRALLFTNTLQVLFVVTAWLFHHHVSVRDCMCMLLGEGDEVAFLLLTPDLQCMSASMASNHSRLHNTALALLFWHHAVSVSSCRGRHPNTPSSAPPAGP